MARRERDCLATSDGSIESIKNITGISGPICSQILTILTVLTAKLSKIFTVMTNLNKGQGYVFFFIRTLMVSSS